MDAMTDSITAGSFEPLVGSAFRVVGPWRPDAGEPSSATPADDDADPNVGVDVTLLLTAVASLDHAGPFEQFSLTFTGPISAPLDQGTYVLDPPPCGLDGLFLVPNAERDDDRVYTASLSVRRAPKESVAP